MSIFILCPSTRLIILQFLIYQQRTCAPRTNSDVTTDVVYRNDGNAIKRRIAVMVRMKMIATVVSFIYICIHCHASVVYGWDFFSSFKAWMNEMIALNFCFSSSFYFSFTNTQKILFQMQFERHFVPTMSFCVATASSAFRQTGSVIAQKTAQMVRMSYRVVVRLLNTKTRHERTRFWSLSDF